MNIVGGGYVCIDCVHMGMLLFYIFYEYCYVMVSLRVLLSEAKDNFPLVDNK